MFPTLYKSPFPAGEAVCYNGANPHRRTLCRGMLYQKRGMFMQQKSKIRRRLPLLLSLLCVGAVGIGWIAWENHSPMVSTYTLNSAAVPAPFSGYRIAHISDLHNAEYGPDNQTLLDLLRAARPDLIVITGDSVDSYHPKPEVSLAFSQQAAQIAPTYYVTGNHEARIPAYSQLEANLRAAGVTVLRNERVEIERDGAQLTLVGLDDPSFSARPAEKGLEEALQRLLPSGDAERGYCVVLAHRPEYAELYQRCGADLVFSGHAHGGQFRLPGIGALVAPGQGIFPTYTAGVYALGDTNMVVSRGLGNSSFPFRVNNRPELVVLELHSTQE